MGRHAKPRNPKEQPQEGSTEDSDRAEERPSRGRHAKDKRVRAATASGEKPGSA